MKSKQTLKVGQKYRVIKDCLGNIKDGTIITVNKLSKISNIIFYDEHGYKWQIENGDELQLIIPNKLTKKDVERLTFGGAGGKTKKESIPFNIIKIDSSNPSSVRLTPDFESITPKKKVNKILKGNGVGGELLFKTIELNIPKKKYKEIKEIKYCKKVVMYSGTERYPNLKEILEKQCEVIDTINLLIKNKL